jgi:glycosyltransferase involved in cell wall biosynthesis
MLNSPGMAEDYEQKAGPVVSVLIPTFNRPRYLSEALSSVVHQNYSNLEIFVIRDGGEEVGDIVNSFNDQRIIFINRKENRGLAFTLNEALMRTQGKYICYLGDDDRYYPNHVSTLVSALENQTDCQVAYSDLYKAYCKVMPDGSRLVLSKVIEVSRDFDRFLMLYFNHVLHVSLMHRRDLVEKTGLYNEELTVLIDWDMTRRLAFFSDFQHICEITGEYSHAAGESDRISFQQRKDKNKYLRNALTIRTTRPAKPWSKIKDMSIIFTIERLNKEAGKTLGLIWRYTFYPYELYLSLPEIDFDRLDAKLPNMVSVPVDPLASDAQRTDAALAKCEGEYVAIVPSGFPVREFWVEDSLCALINSSVGREGFELEGSTDTLWAAVFRKSDLQYARSSFPNLPVRQSLKAAGIMLRRLHPDQIPFQFDQLLEEARLTEKNGDCARAAQIFEYIADHYQNKLWMKTLAANAFFKAGNYAKAAELSCELNRQRPTVDTLLLEAKGKRKENNFNSAIELLERAEQILEGKELIWT